MSVSMDGANTPDTDTVSFCLLLFSPLLLPLTMATVTKIVGSLTINPKHLELFIISLKSYIKIFSVA